MDITLGEALPHLQDLPSRTIVVKIGGSTLGSGDTTLDDLAALQRLGARIVVVHGGGAEISDWLKRIGKEPLFVRGLRVTDAETLDVAVMALAGKVNKQLVAGITARGGDAVGLAGPDGGILRTRIQSEELGFVGEIVEVPTNLLEALLDAGYMPVIAPIGIAEGGQLLNINADTAAGEVAVALEADRLIFLTDVPGIMDERKQVLGELGEAQARDLIARGVISKGMIPKAEACLRALEGHGRSLIVDGREPQALLRCVLTSRPGGTTIER
ncbi:MAG: acetylglutamate kinase [Bacteroidetes bacterium]|nr:acetylglutamate kinase [Bacteroidota bacterium]